MDYHAYRFVDGILPISDYLIEHIKKKHAHKPILKVPVLIDKARFRHKVVPGDTLIFKLTAIFSIFSKP